MKKYIKPTLIIIGMFLTMGCVTLGNYHDMVSKVIDGDTIKVIHNGVRVNLRLAGLDTPETYNNSKARKDLVVCNVPKSVMFAYGKAAKAYVKAMYPRNKLITYTVVGYGKYNRPVAWVEPLNYNLVKLGYARVMDYRNLSPNVMTKLKALEATARANKVGIWKDLNGCW